MTGWEMRSDGGSSIVQPVVRDALQEHEQRDSNTRGTIVDIGTLTKPNPFENIDVDASDITPESKQLVERALESDDFAKLIIVGVELRSGAVFLDLFTYESNPESDVYESIESLSASTGTDTSSIHHLIGKDVDVRRDGNRWIICEHLLKNPVDPTVTQRDFGVPFLIAFLVTPISTILSWQLGYSPYLSSIAGFGVTLLLYAVLLYFRLVTKRDYPLPGILGDIYQPKYWDDEGLLTEDDPVSDVERGTFKRFVTLADEDEYDNRRVVLYNLAIVVEIPPMGERVVPLPAPARAWKKTSVKRVVYHLASSVATLDRAPGTIIPLTVEGDRIVVDYDSLDVDEPRQTRTFAELLADRYVTAINSVFSTPDREELYR